MENNIVWLIILFGLSFIDNFLTYLQLYLNKKKGVSKIYKSEVNIWVRLLIKKLV